MEAGDGARNWRRITVEALRTKQNEDGNDYGSTIVLMPIHQGALCHALYHNPTLLFFNKFNANALHKQPGVPYPLCGEPIRN